MTEALDRKTGYIEGIVDGAMREQPLQYFCHQFAEELEVPQEVADETAKRVRDIDFNEFGSLSRPKVCFVAIYLVANEHGYFVQKRDNFSTIAEIVTEGYRERSKTRKKLREQGLV